MAAQSNRRARQARRAQKSQPGETLDLSLYETQPPARNIPRPHIPPSLGSEKWDPSFSSLYEDTNRSGLSPPVKFSPQSISSPLTQAREVLPNQYMNWAMLGFGWGELYDVEAVDPHGTVVGENTLSNDVLPFFKEAWIPGPEMSGKPGRKWDLKDSEVKIAMEPILKLASRFMTNFNTSDWWDAILKGPRTPIDPARVPPGVKEPLRSTLRSYRRRSPDEKTADPADWDFVVERIEFTFGPGYAVQDANGSAASHLETYHGVTNWGKEVAKPRVHLAWQDIEPLLSSFTGPPLSKSERLLKNFVISTTLLHETAHAVKALSLDNNDKLSSPYFEDDSITEDGYCMENALFGGRIVKFPYNVRDGDVLGVKGQGLLLKRRRLIACVTQAWPDWKTIRSYGDPTLVTAITRHLTLLNDNTPWEFAKYPVSLAYIEEIQQDLFWETQVKKFGAEALKIYPKVYGHVVRGKADDPDFEQDVPHRSAWFADLKNWEHSPPSSPASAPALTSITGSESGAAIGASTEALGETVLDQEAPTEDAPVEETPIVEDAPTDAAPETIVIQNLSLNPPSSPIPSTSRESVDGTTDLLQSAYKKKRERLSRKIARAVAARRQKETANGKVKEYWRSNKVISTKRNAIRMDVEKRVAEFNTFYKNNDAQLDDLMKSKGVMERDMRFRRLPLPPPKPFSYALAVRGNP